MKKVLIVAADFYWKTTSSLVVDAQLLLDKSKIKHETIYVPGVFEIPVTISKYIKKYDGFIALGIVIKGETPHFDFICKSTFDAIMNISVSTKKPIGNGIITALNMSQAIKRSGDPEFVTDKKHLDKGKGKEAAKAVIAVLKNVPKK
ncbi:MAG: 6,7-dimethyl-8-ribityllumazine synthase [Pelagibacterales bacterium]|jgi:6,7-dimethyl-8-ribityllumazine synthase|nr:6,7-dimethyl-8-ribityllumazine synthase [Pelagibacterales bacterium]